MLEICAIASGSNGNCYYIGNEKDAVLIDAGISCKQIVKRMAARGLDIEKIKAVFITHEHSDHLRGARVTAKKAAGSGIYDRQNLCCLLQQPET